MSDEYGRLINNPFVNTDELVWVYTTTVTNITRSTWD